jgi:hypothetical protein
LRSTTRAVGGGEGHGGELLGIGRHRLVQPALELLDGVGGQIGLGETGPPVLPAHVGNFHRHRAGFYFVTAKRRSSYRPSQSASSGKPADRSIARIDQITSLDTSRRRFHISL